MAVDCMYIRLGLEAKMRAAIHAAARATVSGGFAPERAPRVNRNIPTTPKTYPNIDGIEPPAPLCHIRSEVRKGIINRCGSGNQTVPSCSGPGVLESKTRRAMLICA